MEPSNPYIDLGPHAFWRSGVSEASPFGLTSLYSKKFKILPADRIATAGSCFAQHISRHMRKFGYNVLDVEPAPAWLPRGKHLEFGYSTFSARYGNIYTVAQLLQLAREVNGSFIPSNAYWKKGEGVIDALRPAIEPEGFSSEEEARLHRAFHLSRVKELFSSMDVFVFTLGLTECWAEKASGTVYPTAPGVYGGEFSSELFAFQNHGHAKVFRLFQEFLQELRHIRGNQSLPKIILTVSPVPLTATASGMHVLQATTYSKSVLRAVAGDLAAKYRFIDYFPSFEIITNQAARGLFFEANLRSVRPEGVDVVMATFFGAHEPVVAATGAAPEALSKNAAAAAADAEEVAAAVSEQGVEDEDQIQCEEAILEAFGAQ